MRIVRVVAAALTITVASVTLMTAEAGAVFAASTLPTEVTSALHAIDTTNDSLVAEAAPSTTDADSAAKTDGVDIPTDPTKGIKLVSKNGQMFTITLPNADKRVRGVKTRDGVVVYGSRNHSRNLAIPTPDGGVQLWTYIRNKAATETYRYCSPGVRFQLLPIGGAVALNGDGAPIGFVPPPTATEAKTGKSVPTRYSADGTCLVQHVAHKAAGVSYPIVADPYYKWYWEGVAITLTRADMAAVAYGGTQALVPMLMVPGVGWAMISGVAAVAGSAIWAYANRKCFWFFIRMVWPFNHEWGYYSC